MTSTVMTRGQLERELSQRIQSLYRTELGHRPSKITCQILEQEVAVIIDDSFTPAEQLLEREGRDELVKEVRADLSDAMQPKLTALIQDVLRVDVIDFLSDTTIETHRSGFIALLSNRPEFREPKSSPRRG